MNTQPARHDATDRPSAENVPDPPTSHGAGPAGPADAPLPSERDEAGHSTDGIPSETIQQAGDDVKRGLKDTSRGEATDAAYQKQK